MGDHLLEELAEASNVAEFKHSVYDSFLAIFLISINLPHLLLIK